MNRKIGTVSAPIPQKCPTHSQKQCQSKFIMNEFTSIDLHNQMSPKTSLTQPKTLKYTIAEHFTNVPKVDDTIEIVDNSHMNPYHSTNTYLPDDAKSSRQSYSSNSSSNLSEDSQSEMLSVISVLDGNSIISPSTFKNRLQFWEEQGRSVDSFSSLYSSTSLRLKRSSYFGYSPKQPYFNQPEKDFTNTNLNYISKDESHFKSSSSSDFLSHNRSQSVLYIANSMREAKMQSPIDSLLRRIIKLFDSPVCDIINPDTTTPYAFFLFYKWIGLTPDVLGCKLRLLFSYQLEYTDQGRLKNLAQLKSATNQQKLQVTHAFRYWIRVFPEDFPPDSLVLDVMHSLKEAMMKENTQHLINLLELNFFDSNSFNRKLSLVQYPNQVNDLTTVGETSATNHESFEILKIPSKELAKIITWLEYSLFLEIPFSEFKHYTKLQNSSETPHINSSIRESNSVSMWVKSCILNEESTEERALVIEKLIEVANEVRKLHAYQSLMSFIGALNSGCICMQRLHLTWSLVPKEKIRIFEELSSLLTVQNNYYMYRNELEHVKQQENVFYFPVLGVLFKDLIQLDSKTNTLDTGDRIEVNEKKLILVARVIETWRKSQNAILSRSPNIALVDLVKAAIHLCSIIDEEEFYKKSFVHEPVVKECNTCLKENEFFSQFIRNFDKEKIDPSVIKLHVQAMTKTIFSTYDKDNNGYLTEAEFLQIQKNFPFIHNFNQIDKNKDGVIGEEEFYVFLFTSLGLIRNYFTHNFKEFHEILPVVCSHCKCIMWCPIEAAFKCRDCDLICHKYCRDKLVAECKPNLVTSKKHKSVKNKDSKDKRFGSLNSDRNRHHSASELAENDHTEESFKSPRNYTCNANGDIEHKALVSVDDTLRNEDPPLHYSRIDDHYNDVLAKLRRDNELLSSQLNSALFAFYQVKVENRSLQKQLEIVESKLNSTNHDLQMNNVELQRQFSNVRNATGEFLLQQVALLSSSKSQTFL